MSETHASPAAAAPAGRDSDSPNRRAILNRRETPDRREGQGPRVRGYSAKKRLVRDKGYIFREHEIGDLAFIVQSGAVEIVKNAGRREVILGTVGKGGMFGEMALIDNKPRLASARALGPVTLIVITREAINRKLDNIDPFAKGLIGILSDHVRRMASNPEITAS